MGDEIYRRRYRGMVAEIGENLTKENCAKIGYVYSDSIPPPYYENHSKNGLKLLEKLEKSNKFSFDSPGKLAAIMEELKFMDKKKILDDFICNNQEAWSRPASEDLEDPYTRFIPPTQWLRSNSSSAKSESPKSSEEGSVEDDDDDDPIYSEPYTTTPILTMSSYPENFPLHKETLKLLVKPMREIISKGNQRVITSGAMKCIIPRSVFYLVILSGDEKEQPYISAELYTKQGSQFEEDVYHFLAELQVGEQNKKKHRPHQNLYSHSVLIDIPTKQQHLPIQEQGAARCLPATESGHLVASFHAIVSHRHFMNRTLITRPYLTLTFTLKKYLHE